VGSNEPTPMMRRATWPATASQIHLRRGREHHGSGTLTAELLPV